MTKSPYVQAVADIQAALRPFFSAQGFKRHRRTYNRVTED